MKDEIADAFAGRREKYNRGSTDEYGRIRISTEKKAVVDGYIGALW